MRIGMMAMLLFSGCMRSGFESAPVEHYDAATALADVTTDVFDLPVDAHIADAHIDDAHVADAHIADAHIDDAHIDDAHIDDAHIDDAHIDDAHIDDATVADAAVSDAYVDPQCSGQPDMTICTVITDPDRDYDICIDEICVSPGCGDSSCNMPQTFSLADTGQMICYDGDSALGTCPGTPGDEACATTDYCGQDAQYGDGSLMRFSRNLSLSDEPAVSDAISGLMWQGCPAGQSGDSCATGSALGKTWADAFAYCDDLDWGGHSDWRLPSRFELLSIVNYANDNLAIDQIAFPATPSKMFWTLSAAVNFTQAWTVGFKDGFDNGFSIKTVGYYVRCVRPVGNSVLVAPRYLRSEPVSAQSVVQDNTTALMWQGCSMGQSGSLCTGSASTLPWKEALAYCEGLDYGGYSDWRLPNIRELSSIIDDHTFGPAIDSRVFPGTPSSHFWSSSSFTLINNYAWYVNFDYGYGYFSNKTNFYSVRCVRLGP